MFDFEAIGTRWRIDIYQDLSPDKRGEILRAIQTRIDVFDRDYSRFRQDSLVAKMAHESGTYALPQDAEAMITLYQRLYMITKGAFTPLIGQLLVEAGYDPKYSLLPKELHTPPTWEDALEYDFPRLTLKRPALLDVGAIGKGYLIDIVGELLQTFGIQAFCVDAGGDILYRHPEHQPLKIGLEHPANFEQVIGVATLTGEQSLCGSAGNRRAWREFHHIMDPRTLASPKHISAVWTVASTTLLADAMSTCLFFVSPQTLLKYYAFDYLIVRPDYSVDHSPGFPAELFMK